MKYDVKQLAKMYVEYLTISNFDTQLPQAQLCDINSYNEYTYQKIMQQFELLYNHASSIDTTEQFLKGD